MAAQFHRHNLLQLRSGENKDSAVKLLSNSGIQESQVSIQADVKLQSFHSPQNSQSLAKI